MGVSWKPKKGELRSLSSEKRLRREQEVQLPGECGVVFM